jgi:serine/threonine protein kinase
MYSDILKTSNSLFYFRLVVNRLDYGQPEFVAPEVVNGEGACFGSDVWSVGIITYLLLSGVSPFRGQVRILEFRSYQLCVRVAQMMSLFALQNDRETLQRIQMGDIDFDYELWQNVSREAKHFVANMLVYKPEERMSVRQAMQHPWLMALRRYERLIVCKIIINSSLNPPASISIFFYSGRASS